MGAAGHYQKETEDEANSSHSKLSDGEQSKPHDTIWALYPARSRATSTDSFSMIYSNKMPFDFNGIFCHLQP